jgi:hypothetical protein
MEAVTKLLPAGDVFSSSLSAPASAGNTLSSIVRSFHVPITVSFLAPGRPRGEMARSEGVKVGPGYLEEADASAVPWNAKALYVSEGVTQEGTLEWEEEEMGGIRVFRSSQEARGPLRLLNFA